MGVLRYPGVCEYCEASLICASGSWSIIRHTRCRYCNAQVMVFHAATDIREETVVRVTVDCPMPFAGTYTLCGSEECKTEYYAEYRHAQSKQRSTPRLPKKRNRHLPGSPKQKKGGSK